MNQNNNVRKEQVILEMSNIVKDFPGVKALDHANIKLYKGKVTALMGENGAGKSTIMKILFGILSKTSGKIFYDGEEVEFQNPKHALEHGVSMVHQELNQVMTTTVMENIWLGRVPKMVGVLVNHHKMYKDTKEIFDKLNINVDPKVIISNLSVAKRQMVEIAKAVSHNCKVLILDEPTSSLTELETKHLFKIVNNLKKEGVAILFVSHKMDEVFEIADYVTVFRDGKYISEHHISETNVEKIIGEMVGRSLNNLYPQKIDLKKNSPKLLEVKNLSSPFCKVSNVNFDLKEGEILGVAGLVGSQRTELLECLFGVRTKTNDSKLIFKNKEIYNHSPKNAIKNGFAYVTEERKEDGIFETMDINFNMTIANISQYKSSLGFLSNFKISQHTKIMVESLSVKTASQKTEIGTLSGGNQQKVIIGRWLLRQPEVFLMDEPTRGIDVGAKYQIYELIQKLAGYGKGILIVSSEMGELLGICHRIAVMSNGKLAGVVDANKTTQEELMALASKFY